MSESDDFISGHERVWQGLYDRASSILDTFGRKGFKESDDYWIVDDDWGPNFLQIEFQNLNMFRPAIVKALQGVLADYPGWLITIREAARELGDAPGMGLFVYADRVIDDLKREHLPAEFRDMRFE